MKLREKTILVLLILPGVACGLALSLQQTVTMIAAVALVVMTMRALSAGRQGAKMAPAFIRARSMKRRISRNDSNHV